MNMDTDHIISEAHRVLEDYYGVIMSHHQVRVFVLKHPEMVASIQQVGEVETCVREMIADTLGRDLGLQGGWPTGGDDEAYSQTYFLAFGTKALEAGYKLREDCSLWKGLDLDDEPEEFEFDPE